MEADLTEDDPEIWAYLHEKFRRGNLPVNVLYPADKNRPPIILPEVLTQNIVLDAIASAQ
jgi:thiol:disulfide interchange protein